MTAAVITAVVALAAGYLLGRVRPARRALRWAEDRDRGPHGPGWWIAQTIGLAAVAWMLTVHPRRSAANRRSWRDARSARRAPAPRLDPNWPTNRRDTAQEGHQQP